MVKQSFFGPPGQYGRLLTRTNVIVQLAFERNNFGSSLFFNKKKKKTVTQIIIFIQARQSLFVMVEGIAASVM